MGLAGPECIVLHLKLPWQVVEIGGEPIRGEGGEGFAGEGGREGEHLRVGSLGGGDAGGGAFDDGQRSAGTRRSAFSVAVRRSRSTLGVRRRGRGGRVLRGGRG